MNNQDYIQLVIEFSNLCDRYISKYQYLERIQGCLYSHQLLAFVRVFDSISGAYDLNISMLNFSSNKKQYDYLMLDLLQPYYSLANEYDFSLFEGKEKGALCLK